MIFYAYAGAQPLAWCSCLTSFVCRYEHSFGEISANKEIAWQHVLQCQSILPRKFMTTAIHTLTHAWDDIAYTGPWFESWCLPMERWMKFMRKNIFSTAYPGQNLVNRVSRSMRLPAMRIKVRDEIMETVLSMNYKPSIALQATLGMKRCDAWLGVRDFCPIVSGATRVQPPFDLFAMCNDHVQNGDVWLRSRTDFLDAVVNAKQASHLPPPGVPRKVYMTQLLGTRITVSFGASLSHKSRRYSSAFADGSTDTPASWIWIRGADIRPRWDRTWHGRIMYFVCATLVESKAEQFLAAIKVFPAKAIGVSPYGLPTIKINPDAPDQGLHPKVYFVRVEKIGGRVCLGAQPDRDDNTIRWSIHVDDFIEE